MAHCLIFIIISIIFLACKQLMEDLQGRYTTEIHTGPERVKEMGDSD